MNGMKQGLIIGAVAGLFFGFMLGRFGLQQQKRTSPVAAKKKSKLTTSRYKVPANSGPSIGPKNAPVTIVEYSDFECYYCNKASKTLKLIAKRYKNRVRIVYKHYPLGFHKNAHLAAQASMAAHAQGKFWPYHDKLFANFRSLNKAKFIQFAKELKLDVARFKKELNSGKYKKVVDANIREAAKFGVRGTPNFFVNGVKIGGALPFGSFKKYIDRDLRIARRHARKGVKNYYAAFLKGGIAGKKVARRARGNKRAGGAVAAERFKVDFASSNPKDKHPTIGSKSAPVTIVEYSDFECYYCNKAHKTVKQILKHYGPKKVRMVYRHMPLSFHRNAHKAAQASMAAHAQGKFWAFHDKLFQNYRSLSRAKFIRFAKELKLDVARFKKELDSQKYKAAVDADMALGRRMGVNGTPSYYVNGKAAKGYDVGYFRRTIDGLLSGKKPKPVKLEAGNSPTLGSANAKVTIYEFSDFECFYCKRATGTIKQIAKAYGDKVRIVYKHMPLGFHKNAHLAAQASLAAHAQGKFWPYHDKLFADYRNLSKAKFVQIAKGLGLNMARFNKELNSGKYKAQVDADIALAGKLGISGTPSFMVGGKKIVGAQPFAAFKRAIDTALGKKPAPVKIPKAGSAPYAGPKNAKVVITEYSDFECPYCSKAAQVMKQLIGIYKGKSVRFEFRQFPLSFHKNAHKAGQASLAAHAQGKFWAYHYKLFDNQRSLNRATYIRIATELGLDVKRFTKELDGGKYKAAVDADLALGGKVGVNGTPSYYINGRAAKGYSVSYFRGQIDMLLSGKKPKPVKFEVAGSPTLGSANAKVTIYEFSDFECFYCKRATGTIKQIVKKYGNKVRIVYKHMPLGFHKNAHKAAQASMAAHAQGKFWPYHDKLFADYRNLNRAKFIQIAKELKLDVARFTKELDSNKYKAVVDRDMALAQKVGVNGTPSFMVNGKKVVGAQPISAFSRIIDAALGVKAPAPKPVKLSDKGAPTKGPANAKVTIYEFSDFECFYCKRAAGTVAQIAKAYGNSVRIVYKNFPLGFHKNAHKAAQAALAAHAQGKFWPYHDLLFANYRTLSRAKFVEFAKQLKLDVARFTKELDSGKYKAQVDADMAAGRGAGVQGTPTFLVNGKKIVGAQPFSAFKREIDKALGKKDLILKPTRRVLKLRPIFKKRIPTLLKPKK